MGGRDKSTGFERPRVSSGPPRCQVEESKMSIKDGPTTPNRARPPSAGTDRSSPRQNGDRGTDGSLQTGADEGWSSFGAFGALASRATEDEEGNEDTRAAALATAAAIPEVAARKSMRARAPTALEFFSAIEKANISRLSQLVLHPEADVNQPLEDGRSLLLGACQQKQSAAAQLLIKHRADVSFAHSNGETPLLVACEHGMEDVVAELLDAGASEFEADGDKSEFDSGEMKMLKQGLKSPDAGADDLGSIQEEDDDESSPLQSRVKYKSRSMPLVAACRNGHMQICEMLLSHRAKQPLRQQQVRAIEKLEAKREAAGEPQPRPQREVDLSGSFSKSEKSIVCYVCETWIPAAKFKRHCDLCFVQHKMGQEIVLCQTRLQETMYSIHRLVKATKACMGRALGDMFKPVMNGALERVGMAFRNRYWFELCRTSLYSFKNEARSRSGAQVKSCMPLAHLQAVLPCPKMGEFCFQLDFGHAGKTKSLVLLATNTSEFDVWMTAFYKVAQMHPFLATTPMDKEGNNNMKGFTSICNIEGGWDLKGARSSSPLRSLSPLRGRSGSISGSIRRRSVDGGDASGSAPVRRHSLTLGDVGSLLQLPVRRHSLTLVPGAPQPSAQPRRSSMSGPATGAGAPTRGATLTGTDTSGLSALAAATLAARRHSAAAAPNNSPASKREEWLNGETSLQRTAYLMLQRCHGHTHYTTTMQDCMVCSVSWQPFQHEYEAEMRSLYTLFTVGAQCLRLPATDPTASDKLKELLQDVLIFLNDYRERMGTTSSEEVSPLQLLFETWCPMEAKKRESTITKAAHQLLEAVRQKRMLYADWQNLNERFELDMGNKNALMVMSLDMDDPLEAKKAASSSIHDFQLIKPISRGAFGRVFLCRHNITHHLYAVKVLDKAEMEMRNQIANIQNEKRIMAEAENEFVVQLYYAFQSKSYMFLVMDYQPGGDLDTMLENVGCILEPWTRHYIAEMTVAVDYLHQRKIIHRDLKPSNWLISRDGHLKLADFGLSHAGISRRDLMPLSRTKALGEEGEDHGPGNENEAAPETWDMDGFKELGQRVGLMEAKRSFRRHASRQFSTVGTPGYASPEVLQAKGHGPATDWWSIGICLYELTAGLPPFLGDSVGEILQNMLKDQVDFSLFPDEVTADCSDMVRRLLTIDPKERLGSNGAQEIKDHPWLKDIDWEFLRQEPGPFVPTLGSAEDTDYFRNGRQENLAQCMSLLTAIKTDRGDEAVAIEGDGDVMADSACAPNMNTLDVSRRSALDEDEDQTNVFIDKFLNDDEEDDDMLDEMEPPHELLGGTGSRPKEDSFNKKFSVRHLAVLKNFSYKNLVRLHSRNKAQMQRHSFFKGPGGRTRFGAAPPDLVQGQHRLSGVGGTYLRLPGRGKGAIQSAEYQTPPTINEARDFPLQSQVP